MKINYKLVCWHDHAIPVPLEAICIARDQDKTWWWYTKEPIKRGSYWSNDDGAIGSLVAYGITLPPYGITLPPPEPGPWTEQLYWID